MPVSSQVSVLTASPFESYLESLRAQAGIPGMSAALVQNGQIVGSAGSALNQELRIRATPDTPYPIADISQTLASVLVLQCAEERRLRIDDALKQHGGAVPESSATVRQVLATRRRAHLPAASTMIRSATRSSRRSSNRACRSRTARASP